MDVIPSNNILHACSQRGTDGKDKALFEGPPQQAQHTVPLRAVREVSDPVCSGVSNTRIGMLYLLRNFKEGQSVVWAFFGGGNPSYFF